MTMNSDLYIFDIDGTLADNTHRLKYLATDPPNWDEYYRHCLNDGVLPTCRILLSLINTGSSVYFMSGRRESCRKDTLEWFKDKLGVVIPSEFILLRGEGDHRPDTVVKKEWYDKMSGIDKARLVCVFEDRSSMVKIWRSIRVPCLQVADGDF